MFLLILNDRIKSTGSEGVLGPNIVDAGLVQTQSNSSDLLYFDIVLLQLLSSITEIFEREIAVR